MPWKEKSVEDTRFLFIMSVQEEQGSISEICQAFGISRKTGYKWIERFREEGKGGLINRSRRPVSRPGDTPEEIRTAIIKARLSRPFWGAKKLKKILERKHEDVEWPSATTFGNILKREGLTAKAKRRTRLAQTAPLEDCMAPNDVWSTDFKGWWQTKDGKICEPLTVFDNCSRFLLCCSPVRRRNLDSVWAPLQEAFQEYGMPLRFRTDNGSPFATTSLGRLSRLAVRLIRLGITPEWITAGKPQENGRHERMHRTLKLEAATPPQENLASQTDSLDRFRYEYNMVRPHEAIGMLTPGEVYKKSHRKWTGEEQDPQYSEEYQVRRVDSKGNAYWRGMSLFTSEVLKGELIGFKRIREDLSGVYYGPIRLGTIDYARGFVRD